MPRIARLSRPQVQAPNGRLSNEIPVRVRSGPTNGMRAIDPLPATASSQPVATAIQLASEAS